MKNQRQKTPRPLRGRGSNHVLHLYTADVDKHGIHRSFLASMKGDETAIIVSSDDPESLNRELNHIDADLKILRHEEISGLTAELRQGRVQQMIIDAGSFENHGEAEIDGLERYIDDITKEYSLSCLCTYRVGQVPRNMLRQLATFHSKLQLTTGDLTLISGDFINGSMVSHDSVTKIVKDDLEAIILALIQQKAMCGSEIIGAIHIEFNVLLSPGAVYPLLNSLQRRGLLNSLREGKEKIYAPTETSKSEIRRLVSEQIKARKLLSNYLQQTIDITAGESSA